MENIPIHVLMQHYEEEIDKWLAWCERELHQVRHIGNTNFGFKKEDFF